jgi:hypothetical protein
MVKAWANALAQANAELEPGEVRQARRELSVSFQERTATLQRAFWCQARVWPQPTRWGTNTGEGETLHAFSEPSFGRHGKRLCARSDSSSEYRTGRCHIGGQRP